MYRYTSLTLALHLIPVNKESNWLYIMTTASITPHSYWQSSYFSAHTPDNFSRAANLGPIKRASRSRLSHFREKRREIALSHQRCSRGAVKSKASTRQCIISRINHRIIRHFSFSLALLLCFWLHLFAIVDRLSLTASWCALEASAVDYRLLMRRAVSVGLLGSDVMRVELTVFEGWVQTVTTI